MLISDIDFVNMKILSPIDKLDENVNVSSALWSTSRIVYPKLAKKCKTDMLLPRRMHLKLAEERSIMEKNKAPSKPIPEVNKLVLHFRFLYIYNNDFFFLKTFFFFLT